MPEDWERQEVEAAVADYFAMLKEEIQGLPYNKTEHRRALRRLLSSRSDASVERKHMNISAVLRELNHPWIDGYKPYGNYQQLLLEVVEDRLASDRTLIELVRREVSAPAVRPDVDDLLSLWEEPPITGTSTELSGPERRYLGRPRASVDYFAQEAANRSLGRAGEELVVRFESARLHRSKNPRLAERIEHVSQSRGDGLGYDILSYEEDGQERLIEVKTTTFGKRMPFYVSQNEVSCSQNRPAEYHLYRVFAFRRSPGLFTLQGQLDKLCHLDPIQFLARVS